MIYLNNMTDAQVLFIPKSEQTSGALTLRLKNNMEKVITINNVIDLNTSSLYYNVAVSLPSGTSEGEYEYSLMKGELVLSTGLLVVGCSPSSVSQYEKSIQYEQYEK